MYIRQTTRSNDNDVLAIWLRRLAILGCAYLFLDGLTRLLLPLILAYVI